MKRSHRHSCRRIIVTAATTILSAGTLSSAQSQTFDLTLLGLGDADHTRVDGYQFSRISEFNPNGELVGVSSRFNSNSVDTGQSAWFYDPTTNSTQTIGLTDSEHTSFDGYQLNDILAMNDAGFVVGYAERYNRTVRYRGRSIWLYDSVLHLSEKIGLVDVTHTRSDGYQSSAFQQMNSAGQILGTSTRYNASAELGNSLWFFSPLTGTTTEIGLTGAEQTRSDNYQNNSGTLIGASNQVVGKAERFNLGTVSLGQSTWYFTPAGGVVPIGLTGAQYTRSDQYQFSDIVGVNGSGAIVGSTARFSNLTASGQSLWYYSPTSSTIQIGWADAAHTRSDGFQSSLLDILTASGQAIGYSSQYAAGSNTPGQSAWVFNPKTATTTPLGFADAIHTNSTGMQLSAVIDVNAADQIVGYSDRYSPGASTTGRSTWFFDPTAAQSINIGLLNAEHTDSSTGLQYSFPFQMNASGQVVGTADRFDPIGGYAGISTWVYKPGGTTAKIGLADVEHTDVFGFQSNVPQAQNAAGQIVGNADRYNQGSFYLGQSTWFYDPTTGISAKIGLIDSEHTSSSGFQSSGIDFNNGIHAMNDAGQVVGHSDRYSGSTYLGQSVWFFAPTTGTTTKIGLFDGEHTRSDGLKSSVAISLDSAGRVAGYSTRYGPNLTDLGQSAWAFNPANLTTTKIGLFDAMHTRADGYRTSNIDQINTQGQILGDSARYNAGSTLLSNSTWLYDPSFNSTYSLVFSTATDGRTNTIVGTFGNDGLIVGNYERFSDNQSLGTFAFSWSRSDGFFDLGQMINGGLSASGLTRIAGPVLNITNGAIFGETGQTTGAGGNRPWGISPIANHWMGNGVSLDGDWESHSNWDVQATPVSASAVVFNSENTYAVQFAAPAQAQAVNVVAGHVNWDMAGFRIDLGDQLRIGDSVTTPAATLALHDGIIAAPGGVHVFHNAMLEISSSVKSTSKGSAASTTRIIGSLTNDGTIALDNQTALRIDGNLLNTGVIDLGNSEMLIDYVGQSPLNSIRDQIISGYHDGAWNGLGIQSSALRSVTGAHLAVGYAEASAIVGNAGGNFDGQTIDGSTLLVKYTLAGDANLDGTVDVRDLMLLAEGWHQSATWALGDFDYNGIVDANDLKLLAGNWQAGSQDTSGGIEAAIHSLGLPQTLPEPGGLLSLVAIAYSIIQRKRR